MSSTYMGTKKVLAPPVSRSPTDPRGAQLPGGASKGWGGGVNSCLGLRNASMFTNKPALFLALFAFVALFLFFRGLYG